MAVYTKDKQNGARLAALLINQGTDVVRKLFSSTFLSKLTLSSLLTNHESEIRKITNKDQHKLLFPANQASLDKFDLTLLIGFFRNLGHRYSFPYSKKQNNPQTGDHSNAADLTRIRLFRNKLYGHVTTTGVGNDDFKKHWKEIESVLIRLGADKTRIDQFLNDPLDSEMELKYIDMIIEQSNMDVEVMDLVKHVHNDVTDIKKGIKRIEKQVNTTPQERSKRVKMGHSLLTMSSRLLTTILSMCAYILNLVMLTVWQRFVPISDKKLQDELIAELDFHYKRIQYVQPIPGKSCPKVDLNKTYSILKMVDREQRDSLRKYGWSDQWMVELKTEDNDLEKIFISSDDAETPRRILIEGEAGIGKTSLCRRLASDWRSKKDYLKDRFKFILLLEGKKYRKGLKEALREQGLISESINCDEMWEYLHNNSEDILWVIDGLDELSISNE
uniref:Uncharacterized protein LOC102805646 n=1 Tax=Saccoglossus kowalevskii TaxID=10224 RepID=A0ABM0M4U9_SACKO